MSRHAVHFLQAHILWYEEGDMPPFVSSNSLNFVLETQGVSVQIFNLTFGFV